MSRRTRLPGADELFRSTGAGRSSARDSGDGQHAELTGSSAGPADERVQRAVIFDLQGHVGPIRAVAG